MASIQPISQKKGVRSFSAFVTTASIADTVDNADLLALCEAGPLKDLLSATYASADAFLEAFCAAGGAMSAVNSTGGTGVIVFDVDGSGKPRLDVASGGSGVRVALRMDLSWSASS